MADGLGFTYAEAKTILQTEFTENTYIGLSSTIPAKDGSNVTELSAALGYKRAKFGKRDADQKKGQIANAEIIFFFVALGNCGSATHLAMYKDDDSVVPFFTAKLENPMSIGENYVPLIREYKLIIGLDIDTLDTTYTAR